MKILQIPLSQTHFYSWFIRMCCVFLSQRFSTRQFGNWIVPLSVGVCILSWSHLDFPTLLKLVRFVMAAAYFKLPFSYWRKRCQFFFLLLYNLTIQNYILFIIFMPSTKIISFSMSSLSALSYFSPFFCFFAVSFYLFPLTFACL